MYIHERDNWTDFRWDDRKIALRLDVATRRQGVLFGKLSTLGFDSQLKAMAENITRDLVHSSEIEGVRLNVDEVRSSVARRLGLENKKAVASSHYVDGVVAAMVDATEHYDRPLTKDLLCSWQSTFFPYGVSNGCQIEVGKYRTHEEHIVSGYLGRERVHYVAPSPERLDQEMSLFLDWFNSDIPVSPVICSAIAHFWFVSIHPFEDGNGRLARIIGDIFLSRGDGSKLKFYNISSEINRDKRHYYEILERTQRGDGDITEWLVWYVDTLISALDEADSIINTVLNKSLFWQRCASIPMSQRQTDTLNLFLDGYEAKLTTKVWADINKCSRDTAGRDILDLVNKGVLREDVPGSKRPNFSIVYADEADNQCLDFSQVSISQESGVFYLNATYRNSTIVHERILRLDAERFERGDLPLASLLAKYCAFLAN